MKKDLESIYQEAFNNNSIESEDWNLPSDAVWDNIEEAIKPKQKRRFLWLWFAIVCLTIGSCFLFITSNYNNPVNATTTAMPAQGMQQPNENNANNTEVQASNMSTKVKTNTDNYNIPADLSKNNPTNRHHKITTSSANNSIIPLTEKFQENLFSNSINTDNPGSIKDTQTTKIPQQRIAICDGLPRLNSSFLLSDSPALDLSIPTVSPEISKNRAIELTWSAYALNVKNQTRSTTKSSAAFSGESLKFAYQTGLTMRKHLNKSFFVEFGAQYSRLTYQLKYEMGLPFNGVGEMENDKGNYDNTYNGAVATSIGELKMQMILERQLGHSVTQGEIIPLSAEGEASISSLRLPIAFGFSKAIHHRININTKVLFLQNINLTHDAKFKQVLSHHDAVQETLTEVLASPKPNAWIPEVGLGLEVAYRLTPRWSIKAEAIGINDMRYIYQNDMFKNKHRYFGGGIGIGFRL